MKLSKLLQTISSKKLQLDSLRPLSNEQVKDLKKIYDIDLTYNSNAIEGSTLTYSETKLILNEGLTIGGKKMDEHLEVINHKDALDFIESISHLKSNEIKLKDIKDIHYLILKAISSVDAGKYRIKPVGVRKSDGTIYQFTQPLKVQEEMDNFIYWLQNNTEDLDPITLATQAHYKFVTIHPFIDGNGRTARLLMNLILIQNGYPPAVIKVSNRVEYIQAIEKVQNENILEDFSMVIAKAVDESLDTYLMILTNDMTIK
ncbi:MAG: Fic family protein [Campylobacterota bacterium]|nr:Fic family protein [Campylobacterota bacterium]